MTITKQRALDYVHIEWGTYVDRFHRLPLDEQKKRVTENGYERFRDMLAHILAWWQEGMGIILALAENRPFERKKYDFDAFNAEAVSQYKDMDEAKLMSSFEGARLKMAIDLKSMDEAVFENRRVQAWLNAIIINHAREHLVALSRFMTLDILQNEWASYRSDFDALSDEKKKDFLSAQGFNNFHDLIAHIIGWWEEGVRIISGIMDSPSFKWESHDTDAFNVELTKKYSSWSDDDLFIHYETVRKAMIELVMDLPEDAFMNEDIEGWLRDDVVGHYDDHPIPG